MLIYILVFGFSILLFWLSKHIKKNWLRRLIILCAILVPSFLAGARDIGVGYDTSLYGASAYRWALAYDFKKYISLFRDSYLFYSVWYFLFKISGTTFWAFFTTEFVIEVLYVKAIENYSRETKNDLWLGMALYYFVFFTYSMSLMRQSVAIAVMLFAYTRFLKNNNYKKYFLCCIISFCIHSTALICLFIVIVYKAFDKFLKYNLYKRIILYLSSVLGVSIIIVGFDLIIKWLTVFDDKYNVYNSNYGTVKGTFVSWFFFFLLFMWVICMTKLMKTKTITAFELYSCSFGLAIFWINLVANNSYRISFYFLSPLICLYSNCFRTNGKGINKIQRQNSLILSVFSLVLLCFIFYIMTVSWRMNSVYPYKSTMLGIV